MGPSGPAGEPSLCEPDPCLRCGCRANVTLRATDRGLLTWSSFQSRSTPSSWVVSRPYGDSVFRWNSGGLGQTETLWVLVITNDPARDQVGRPDHCCARVRRVHG